MRKLLILSIALLAAPATVRAQLPPVVTVTVTAPTSGSTVTGATVVTADTSGPGATAVAGVQFTLDGANLGQEDTAAPWSVAWDTLASTNGSHTVGAVARDQFGFLYYASPVTVTVFNNLPYRPPDTMTRFEDNALAIVYTSGTTAPGQPADWWHGSRSRDWSSSTASFNRSAGARASFTFTGTTIRWIGFRSFWAGIANLYLDGSFVSEIDLYVPDERPQTTVFSQSGLQPGSHTIVVESTGRKNPQASDYAVVVDAFDVGPAAAPSANGTRVEETDASIAYSAGWVRGDRGTAWSAGTASATRTSGARATFTFTGTTATWMGARGPDTGIANVYLDGSLQKVVDTYSPVEVVGPVFTVGSLAPEQHTLVVEATGIGRALATDSLIFVDAFDIRSRFEDTDAGIQYTADWSQLETKQSFSGSSGLTGTGTAAISATAGGLATFTFAGTGVSWIGAPGPSRGIARIYVDGVYQSDVDCYAAVDQMRTVMFTAANLADGAHTIGVQVSGTQNPAATGASIVVDAFDVVLSTSVPFVTRTQQTDPSVAFSGTWTAGSRFQFWSGEYASYSSTAGAQATFTFTGQNVRWLGDRQFAGGIAHVYIDGVYVTDVDTHAPLQEEYQAALFVATNLPAGTHVLTIQVTGTANPASSGTIVVVDAFDVY